LKECGVTAEEQREGEVPCRHGERGENRDNRTEEKENGGGGESRIGRTPVMQCCGF